MTFLRTIVSKSLGFGVWSSDRRRHLFEVFLESPQPPMEREVTDVRDIADVRDVSAVRDVALVGGVSPPAPAMI